MLEGKQIQRHYLAITTGSAVPGRKFTFRQPIGRDRHAAGNDLVRSGSLRQFRNVLVNFHLVQTLLP